MSAVRAAGSLTTIEPKPMYIGGGPAARNAARLSGGVNLVARSRKKKPEISMCAPQSFGLGIKAGDQQYVYGIFAR